MKKSNTVFRTENKPCFEYRWPTTRHHTTSNAILSRFTLLYDPYKHKLFTPFQQLDHGNAHHGFSTLNYISTSQPFSCRGPLFAETLLCGPLLEKFISEPMTNDKSIE